MGFFVSCTVQNVGASLLAIAVCQTTQVLKLSPHREQARSHRGTVSYITTALAG